MAESETPWPKRGLAGQIHAAKSAAPEDAEDMAILSVGWVAFNENRDVEAVWAEVEDADC